MQRLGYLLDLTEHRDLADKLAPSVVERAKEVAPLVRAKSRGGAPRDERWRRCFWHASATAQNLSAWPRALRSASKLTLPEGSTRRLMRVDWGPTAFKPFNSKECSMSAYQVHTLETAPEGSKASLRGSGRGSA